MSYRIELRPAAVKALRRIDPQDRPRIQGAIALLGENPRPPGAKALQGRDGLRVRVGDYRITYTIHDDVLLIAVVTPSVTARTSTTGSRRRNPPHTVTTSFAADTPARSLARASGIASSPSPTIVAAGSAR